MKPSSPNSANGDNQAITPRQHGSYYFKDDPMAIFLVEDQLFKVHRCFLSGSSEVFRNMFACPVEEGMDPEGASDDRPIQLPGVTVKEFEALLGYFYRSPHLKPKNSKEESLQVNLDLLSISHRFVFDGIFQHVLGELQPVVKDIPAIQRFSLGQKYNLEEWILSAYETLLDRATPLTAHEVEVLGSDKVVRYIRAREAMHQERWQAELENEKKKFKARQVPQPPSSWNQLIQLPPTAPTTPPENPRPTSRKLVEKFFL